MSFSKFVKWGLRMMLPDEIEAPLLQPGAKDELKKNAEKEADFNK